LPIIEREVVRLGDGGRVALRCRLAARDQNSTCIRRTSNMEGRWGHPARSAQRLLGRIEGGGVPAVIAGDLNGPPESRAATADGSMRSAHVVVHGCEPAGTARPLSRDRAGLHPGERGIEVLDARVAFDAEGEDGDDLGTTWDWWRGCEWVR
jgi:hypothetical protein